MPVLSAPLSALLQGIEPTSGRFQLLTTLDEVMAPISEWPHQMAHMMLSAHVSYEQRRRLVCFLAVNGCPPGFIADWATAAPGYLRDQSAVQDVITLLTKWKTGTLKRNDGEPLTAWCMWTSMYEPVVAPNFANETVGKRALDCVPGSKFWDDAIQKLKIYKRDVLR